jgi:hypothetical protein
MASTLPLIFRPARVNDEEDVFRHADFAEARQEFGEMQVGVTPRTGGHNDADRARLACCETLSRAVRTIAGRLHGLQNALTRALIDFRIAVQGTTDRRLREAQMLGQLFEVHGRHSPGSACCIAPKRFDKRPPVSGEEAFADRCNGSDFSVMIPAYSS